MFGPPVDDLCETKNNCTFYEKCKVLNDIASCEGEQVSMNINISYILYQQISQICTFCVKSARFSPVVRNFNFITSLLTIM